MTEKSSGGSTQLVVGTNVGGDDGSADGFMVGANDGSTVGGDDGNAESFRVGEDDGF